MKKMLFCYSIILMLCAGCVSTIVKPSDERLSSANFGIEISKEEGILKATEYLRKNLIDPNSAMVEWGTVEKWHKWNGLLYGGGYTYGYSLSAYVNSKNRMGGYTGRHKMTFVFINKELVDVIDNG